MTPVPTAIQFGVVVPGNPGPMSDEDLKRQNIAMGYQSEQRQGYHWWIAGLGVVAIGVMMSNWWVIAAGIFVFLVGRARMQRASDTYNKQTLEMLGAKV